MKNISPKEAIEILKDMKIDIPLPQAAQTQKKRNNALDAAITALNCLEKLNSSDCISRQAAIENALTYLVEYCGAAFDEDMQRMLKDRLDSLPSAQPEQRWIPCSERLPIDAGHYLCSFEKPNRIDHIHVDLAYWTGGRWYGYRTDAICAWMPLPEPYREESEKHEGSD